MNTDELIEKFFELLAYDEEGWSEWEDSQLHYPEVGKYGFIWQHLTEVNAGRTKMDRTKRISVISEVAEIFNAKVGDEFEYIVRQDEVVIRKVTVPYKGYDIEKDIIRENLFNYLLNKKINKMRYTDRGKGSDYDKAKQEYLEMLKKEKEENGE